MIESKYNSVTLQEHDGTLDVLLALHDDDKRFSQNVHIKAFKRGAVFASSVDLSSHLYILISGTVNLVCMNPKGRRIVISTLDSGAIFGEGAIGIASNPYDSNVFAEAARDIKVWTIPASEARNMVIQYPILSWGLLQTYGSRLLQIEDGLEDVAYKTLPERLAGLLLDLSERENTRELRKISHQILADYLGTYRETVSTLLREFKSQGIVDLGYRRIQILDMESLEEIAGIWN